VSGEKVEWVTGDFSKVIGIASLAPYSTVADYGLTLPEFYIENISLPEEVEKALDKRTSVGIAGDLNKYMQFSAAEALGKPGSGGGDAMTAGIGAAMGMSMAQNMGPWGAPAGAAAPPPPPPPAARQWHLAENGATKGPFAETDLAAMATSGQITPATHVWSAGMDGWKTAAETDLARLFAQMPPPPPPGA
jgi:hypothetical protein